MDDTTRRAGEVHGNTRALVLATLAFLVTFYAWSMLGPLGPDLQDLMGLSEFQLAMMIAVPVLMGSLMRIPLGLLSDRHGGRVVFTGLMAFTLLPLAALAVAHDSYPAVIVFGFLLGLAGASFAVGVPFVSGWYPGARQGMALGLYGIGMGGTTLGALTAPGIADRWGLTAPFVVAMVMVAITAVAVWLLAEDPPTAPSRPAGGMLAPLSVFRERPAAWAPTFYYLLVFGGFVAMFAYLPTLLTSVHGLDKPDAAARAAGFALVAVIGRPVGGWLADRVGPETVLRVSFLSTVLLASGLAAFYEEQTAMMALALPLAAVFGLGMGAVFKQVAQDFSDAVGAVTGVVGAAGGLGGFFPPLVMAFVKETTGSYTIGFALLAVTAVAAVVVLHVMGRVQRRPVGAASPAVPLVGQVRSREET